MTSDDEAVLHGYTMKDIEQLADRVVTARRKWMAEYVGLPEARECAWEAIVTLLCEADEPPTDIALREAGWRAVMNDRAELRTLHGKRHVHEGFSSQFETYWQSHAMPANFEELLVDTIGFRQAWAAMRPYHRDTFQAYVQAGYNKARAAELLGIGRQAMHKRITLGYATFAALWYGDEPVPPRGSDRDTGWERPDQRGAGNTLNQWRAT